MRKVRKFALSLVTAVTILSCFLHTFAGFEAFEDVAGHWAEEALRVAYDDNFLLGVDNAALPDGELTVAQAVTILNRVLGAEIKDDISKLDIPDGAWYGSEIAKGLHLGLISAEKRNFNEAMSRQDAFTLLAEAFSIVEAKPDFTVLDNYSDSAKIRDENTRAIATLVSRGIVKGYEGKLNVDLATTRAEFLTVIYRIVSELVTPPAENNSDGNDGDDNGNERTENNLNMNGTQVSDNIAVNSNGDVLNLNNGSTGFDTNSERDKNISSDEGIDTEITGIFNSGIMFRGNAKWYDGDFKKGIWFDCTTTDIDLNEITTPLAVIRSHILNALSISGASQIDRLTIAAQSGDITVSPQNGSIINTLAVGTGGGQVTVSGISIIEVTGSNRNVTITDNAELILISGSNSIIHILPDVEIGTIELLNGSSGSRVELDGHADEIDISSNKIVINGSGSVDIINTQYTDSRINAQYTEYNDIHDYGITKAVLNLELPATLPVNQPLIASAAVKNADNGLSCDIKWFIDDVLIVDSAAVTGGKITGMTYNFEYNYYMAKESVVKAVLTYKSKQGELQEISASKKVKIDNFSDEHYTKTVLEKVTLGYKGDFTLKWAEENDLIMSDKELWVNAKGYTSSSKYLLWINIAYQRVNIFEGKAGQWKLIRSCIVGTGAPGRGTATGVTTTTYKQRDGWVTGSYMCKPVVRFRPGTGYAFHSRLYYPYSDRLVDAGIGYPISNGCVRMYDEDIWFIYDNIPDGTTVVIH